MNALACVRILLPAALLLGSASPAPAADFLTEAQNSTLLFNLNEKASGTTRHGYTWSQYEDPRKAPKGVPARSGWYKPAGQGTTTYWDDKNSNGQKDDGELRQVPYWLFIEASMLRHMNTWNGTLVDANNRIADETAGQPAARRISSLFGDSPIVAFGNRCFAVAQGIEFWAQTDVAVLIDPGIPGANWTFSSGAWLRSNRKDYNYATARFPDAPSLDAKILSLLAGACPKACSEVASAILSAWNAQAGARIASGPGFKGLYPLDLKVYLPTREELGGNFVWKTNTTSSNTDLDLHDPELGMYADIGLRSEYSISQHGDDAITKVKERFAHETQGKGTVPSLSASFDEALETTEYSRCSLWFRRANVLGHVSANLGRTGFTPAKARALVHRLADIALIKLSGGVVPPPPPPAPSVLRVSAKFQDTQPDLMGEGRETWIEALVQDGDNDPAPCEEIQIAVVDPAVGVCNTQQLYASSEGKATFRYRTVSPGANTIILTHKSGKCELKIKHGGLLLDVQPQKQDGTLEIRAKILDSKDLRPMGGAPVTLTVYSPQMPGRGKISPEEALTIGDDTVLFTFTPPPQREGGPDSLEVDIWANVDKVGYPLRLSAKAKATLRLPPPEKQP